MKDLMSARRMATIANIYAINNLRSPTVTELRQFLLEYSQWNTYGQAMGSIRYAYDAVGILIFDDYDKGRAKYVLADNAADLYKLTPSRNFDIDKIIVSFLVKKELEKNGKPTTSIELQKYMAGYDNYDKHLIRTRCRLLVKEGVLSSRRNSSCLSFFVENEALLYKPLPEVLPFDKTGATVVSNSKETKKKVARLHNKPLSSMLSNAWKPVQMEAMA